MSAETNPPFKGIRRALGTVPKQKRNAEPKMRAASPPRPRTLRSKATSKVGYQRRPSTPLSKRRSLQVSTCLPEHVADVARIHKLAYLSDHFSSRLPSPALEGFYGTQVENNDYCLVAKKNDNVVGFIIAGYRTGAATSEFTRKNRWQIIRTLIRNPRFVLSKIQTVVQGKLGRKGFGSSARLRLLSIAVHPGYQGQGVATDLLTALERRLQADGISAYGLSAKRTNTRAVAVYERAGFDEEGEFRGNVYFRKEVKQVPVGRHTPLVSAMA